MNKIRCKHCGGTAESTHRHHYQTCPCGKVAADGGNDYLKRMYPGGNPEDHYEEVND
jgi:hypothetical protein